MMRSAIQSAQTAGNTISTVSLALGSNDLRVAEHAAELYLQGWAPMLMFSVTRII
jgi:hypothetical protein